MGRARGSEGLSILPKMAYPENGRAQNQLLVGLAQKPGLFLQDSVQHEDTEMKSSHQSRPQAGGKEANATGHCLCL